MFRRNYYDTCDTRNGKINATVVVFSRVPFFSLMLYSKISGAQFLSEVFSVQYNSSFTDVQLLGCNMARSFLF